MNGIMPKFRMIIKYILFGLLALIVLAVMVFVGIYFTRFKSIASIKKLTNYEDGFDLYRIDIQYNYDLDRIIKPTITDNQTVADSILSEALPLIPIHMEAPEYGCSAFSVTDTEGHVLMGRNYDFDSNSSAMLAFCAPKNGYRSVSTVALDHLDANRLSGIVQKVSTLAAPFICLDGMNEKGVSVCVLWVDSVPTAQKTEKPDIFTTLAIRLILDRAATTQEAVDLLLSYDMFAVSGGDYHFYITDASGDGRVVEYDPHSETREIVDIPVRTATNFYQLYIDKVFPNQNNGIYGHGRERYDAIEEVLTANEGAITPEIAWQALEAAQQVPKANDITSNTQWSIVYDDTALTADITIRRNWGKITSYGLDATP